MAIAVRDEGAKVNSNINVTPMVDVMLVLLIIFMVITPMLQKGVTVDLAKVNNPQQMPDADKEDALIVAIMRNEQLSIHQIDVGFDAAKTLFEGVEQRSRMLIIIMRMSMAQRKRSALAREGKSQQQGSEESRRA